ncbi:hypothetical protein [Roseibium alexandrii]|uniref:hypothetical protein n=1 Tax=Roseibium alexandrii TaxID=388408 RepID=UPI0037530945
MTPEKFVEIMRCEVIDGQINSEIERFNAYEVGIEHEHLEKDATNLFASLSPAQKKVFLSILRQVSLDTTASVLAVLDGVRMIEGVFDDFHLTYGDGKTEIVGDLASILLEKEELSKEV